MLMECSWNARGMLVERSWNARRMLVERWADLLWPPVVFCAHPCPSLNQSHGRSMSDLQVPRNVSRMPYDGWSPSVWQTFSERPTTAPRTFVDKNLYGINRTMYSHVRVSKYNTFLMSVIIHRSYTWQCDSPFSYNNFCYSKMISTKQSSNQEELGSNTFLRILTWLTYQYMKQKLSFWLY